ncbi:hypothetical protein [Spirillospora sp. NBC_01491]|uniref:hypothetical protein n=1 Tax=Spirillospora sp. NBC_01491 TaxID=2976007 RepID=UPI002E32518B|nr:hypothetical protein [Spirillospora sp. NBC_01491]
MDTNTGRPGNDSPRDRTPSVRNIVNGEAGELIQLGHLGQPDDEPRGASVSNEFNGTAGKVIQAGNIYGGLTL